MSDYILQIRIKNGPFLRAMRAAGFKNASELSRACGVHPTIIGMYLNLKLNPWSLATNDWRKHLLTIAAHLKASPEELFPPQHLTKVLRKNSSFEVDLSLADIAALTSTAPDQQKLLEKADTERLLFDAIDRLTPRLQRILRLRYGLQGEDEHTLDEIAVMEGGVQRERIRQLEMQALRKLREQQYKDGGVRLQKPT